MNLYVSTAELKTYMGISASTHDTLLAMLNKSATDHINQILSVTDLALHKVTDEVHSSIEMQQDTRWGTYLRLKDMHAVAIGTIMDDEVEYVQDEAYDIDNYVLHLEDYLTGGYRKVTVDYAAGWNASGMATITVTDYANIAADATVTLGAIASDGYTVTRGVDWTAGSSNDTEAENLAAALDAKAGTRAFAIKNVVYVIEDTNPQATGRTLATSDSTRLAKSASTLASVDFPESIREAVMMLVSAKFNARKNPKLKSYTIGSKTVTFQTEDEFKSFKALLMPYMRSFIGAL